MSFFSVFHIRYKNKSSEEACSKYPITVDCDLNRLSLVENAAVIGWLYSCDDPGQVQSQVLRLIAELHA